MAKERGTGFWLGVVLIGLVVLVFVVYVASVRNDINSQMDRYRREQEQNRQLYGSPPRRPNEQPSQGQGGGTRGR